MKVEYKTIPLSEISNLNEYGKEWWIFQLLVKDVLVWYREIKKTRKEKKAEMTSEYEKFHKEYPKKSGITSDSVINKINTSVKEWRFERIMEWVERYNKMIKVENIVPKFILNAETFLNQKRYEDPFDIFENRVPISEQWILEKIKNLNELEIKEVMKIKKEYEARQHKDCSPWAFDNIIAKVTWKDG